MPKLFSFNESLSFLDRCFDECLYNLTDTAVSRLIKLSDGKGIIKVYQNGKHLEIELQKSSISEYNLQEVKDYVMEWFDLNRNIEPFYKLLNNHPLLSELSIKGIGIWTANYVLMKSIRDMSCITYGDSGLNKAIHTIFKTKKKPTKDEIDNAFKDFKNWESYLNFYLWKSLT